MKFMADGMLGRLARWLRLAGHDVAYIGDMQVPPEGQDDVLLERAKLEGRTLLTCDLALHRRARRAGIRTAFIGTKDIVSQLAEISKRSGERIEIDPENSRCPVCNGTLEPAASKEVRGLVPETVARTGREFWRCVDCGKIYWKGRHWKSIIEMASRYNRMME
jgi:uncharacterized protein with PIN domain